MNVHVAPALAPAARRNDRELIALCKRARRLFTREHAAERRLFAMEDCGQDSGAAHERIAKVTRAAIDRLEAVVAEIASVPATTPEGLSYKAAMLAPWIEAGFVLDDEVGPGRELALSIASDARRVGMDAHEDLQRLRRGAR